MTKWLYVSSVHDNNEKFSVSITAYDLKSYDESQEIRKALVELLETKFDVKRHPGESKT